MIKPYWYIKWRDFWITTEDIEFISLKWDKIIIPKWFISDFWSYPRIVWLFYTPLNLTYLICNIIHDFRYSNLDKSWMTRQQIDNEYLENGRQYGKIFHVLAFIRVRLFWQSHFKKDLPFDKKLLN